MRTAGRRYHNRGQSIVLFVLGFAALVGFLALAVDGGRLLSMQRHAKSVADETALAAGYAWARGYNWEQKADEVAQANGYTGSEVIVTMLSRAACEEASGGTVGDNCACFQSKISAEKAPVFGQVVGLDALKAEGASVVRACKNTPLEYGYAVRSKSDLKADGMSGVMAWGRVRGDEDVVRSGMGHIWSFGSLPPLPFGGEVTAGEDIYCNGGFMNGCMPMMDMMAIGPAMFSTVQDHVDRPPMSDLTLAEPAACQQAGEPMTCAEASGLDGIRSGIASMIGSFSSLPMQGVQNFQQFTGFGNFSDMMGAWQDLMDDGMDAAENADEHCLVYPPGRHDGIHARAQQTVFLMPGTHCLDDDFQVEGNAVVMGHDVSLHFNNGGVHIASGSTVLLDAGRWGDFDLGGMLFYNPDRVQLGAVSGTMLVGSIYAPNGRCDFNGAGMLLGWSQILCNEVFFRGGFQAMVAYSDDYVYHLPAEITLLK